MAARLEKVISRRQKIQEPFITGQKRYHWELKTTESAATGEYFYVTSPVFLIMGEHRLSAQLMTSSGKGPSKAFDVGLYIDFSQADEKDRPELKQIFSVLGDSAETSLERDRRWRVSSGESDNHFGLIRAVPTGNAQEQAIPLASRDPRVKFDEFAQALETIYNGEIRIEPAVLTQQYLL